MKQYKCLVIEDEPLAAEVLQDYIRQVPFLELRAVCSDAIFAMDLLQREKVDLIFLDIHLPRLKGLDFLKTLRDPVNVIITSAYQEYALQGYEFNVVDYLLKPFEFARFLVAVNKLRQMAPPTDPGAVSNSPVVPHAPAERQFLFFNVTKKKVKVFLDEIQYVEGLKEYIRIVTAKRTILTRFQLGNMDDLLSGYKNFIRVHRSYIIAKDKVDYFTATDVEVAGKLIPIGRSYREHTEAAIGQTIG